VNISTAGYFTYDSNLGIANRTDIVPLQGFWTIPKTGLKQEWSTPLVNLTPDTTYCYKAVLDRFDIKTGQTTTTSADAPQCFKTSK
jgi:hypothetical protein